MSTAIEKFRRGQNNAPAPRTVPPRRPADPAGAAEYPSLMAGYAHTRKTTKGFDIITCPFGRARMAFLPTVETPDRPRAENAPDFFIKLSESVSPERRAAGDYGNEMTLGSAWFNTAADGTEYVNTTLEYADETHGGVFLQLWPIKDAPTEGPHWVKRWVFGPKKPAGSATPTNSQPTAVDEAPTEPAATEDQIPF